MKLYGSVENRLQEGHQYGELKVGMGATQMLYTDRQPFTVIEIISEKKVVVQADNFKRIDNNGMSECQEYEYAPNKSGVIHVIKFLKGGWMDESKTKYALGIRERYYDYSF